mgnify:CR=1 FL=1
MSHVFNYEEVVIGSSLKALLFAFHNRLPVVFSQAERPFRFDYLSPAIDLSCLKMENLEKNFQTFGEILTFGIAKEELWERLLFFLSLDGKAPFTQWCNSMRLYENKITCSNEYAKIAEINFQTCYFFGDENCSGIKEKTVVNPTYICYDWIAFNRGGKHNIDHIQMQDDFVNEVWFYPSDRIDGNTPVKDACIVSRIKEEDMLDFDFSETMARFKLISEMETRGMKGVFNGHGPTGKPKYYKFRTTHITRTKRRNEEPTWEEQDAIKIPKLKEYDLLKDLSSACVDYDRFLRYL